MLTQIEFFINREELIDALKFLSPFVVPPRKEDDEYDDEDSEIRLPELYFYDKVTFCFNGPLTWLSVLTKEGVRVSKTCDMGLIPNDEVVSFCMPHAYLLQEILKYGSHDYIFKEDKFFGFKVSDYSSGEDLFKIDAHSVSKLPSFFENQRQYIMSIENDILIKVLKEFPKYTIDSGLRPYAENIWFYINEGICRVVACSGSQLRQEVFPTSVSSANVFSLPGKFANRILKIVENWAFNDKTCLQIIDDIYLRFYFFKGMGLEWERVEVPLCKTEMPSLQRTLNKRNVSNSSSVRLRDLQSALRMFNTMDNKKKYVLMHFFLDHVNLYCGELFSEAIAAHFIDANCDGEFIIKLNQKDLEAIIQEIYTEEIIFSLVDDNLLHINNEDEPLFGDIIRIQCTAELQDEDLKLLERGDKSLNSHEGYIEKYLTKHDDKDDSFEERYATLDEMKAEALLRMKEVIDYTDLINYFEETGLPQVYEPPYGASYILENDELEKVREIEDSRNIFVWGIIRCFMMYNRQEVTVDCMLHVSQNKDEWEQEREDLRNGMPFVYTITKEFPLIDHGHINVYKSKGGTLLRE